MPPRPPIFDDRPAQRLPLKDAVQTSLTEARMVLPGLQALFGFQMIAVFNQRFDYALSTLDKGVHLASLLAVAAAIGLVMTPAAYHREVHEGAVTPGLLRITSRLINLAFVPLAAGLAGDLYVVARVITEDTSASLAIAGVSAATLAVLWFAFPAWARRRRRGLPADS